MGVRVTGVEEAKERIEATIARARDLTPVLLVVAQDTRSLIDDSFAGSQTPEGSPWAPLAASTIKGRRGGSSTPLVDTARLRNSITANGRGTTLQFGSNVPYAGPQQFGASRSGSLKTRSYAPRREAGTAYTVTTPARSFLPVTGSPGSMRLMTGGAAGQHWRDVRSMVRRYIVTGEVG